ncbi:MAG: hypothetical protein US89_C0007G0044 [Candidatus Peregrinibacteria bacterium GW2011_GWF2_38_29]|nr:MAG: hypothetical protein US89_C0007G0044 [Candidatus Peregrinibacteria bacterium GW2011_GWF2_38_29]HBB02860.1 DNA-protecting protein DprA [Candidatus Peregrinibacteria bacterium]
MEKFKCIYPSEFPAALRHISDPPKKLYIKGNPEVLNNISVAVVGTRRPSLYGRMQAEIISDFLSKNNVTIVSGLAKGIDILAHLQAIKNNTPTIAVLGSGLKNIYPQTHKRYIEEIAKNGAVITEYEPLEPPINFHFPERNRIIAALSEATVVIEAPEQSGAIITAHLAVKMGKEVFAVPSDIDRHTGKGSNKLLRDGEAHPLLSPHEILESLNIQIQMPFGDGSAQLFDSEKQQLLPHLTDKETRIYRALSRKSAKTIDEISASTNMPAQEIMISISFMEMQSLVERYGAGFIKK